MNSPAFGLRVASVIIGLAGLIHLVRLFRHFQVVIGRHHAPLWLSGAAFVGAGLVSLWLWKLSSAAKPAKPTTP